MIVLLIKLPQLCDAIMLISAKTFKEHFQHLVESIPQRIMAVLKAKIDPICQQHLIKLYCVLLCFSLHSVVHAFDSFCYPAFTYEILYLFIEIKLKNKIQTTQLLIQLYWFKNLRKLIRTIKKSSWNCIYSSSLIGFILNIIIKQENNQLQVVPVSLQRPFKVYMKQKIQVSIQLEIQAVCRNLAAKCSGRIPHEQKHPQQLSSTPGRPKFYCLSFL